MDGPLGTRQTPCDLLHLWKRYEASVRGALPGPRVPGQTGGGVAVAGPSPGPGSPMGHSGESGVGGVVHGQGRGPGRSVNAGAPHKARRVGELRESDEGSLLLLPFRCAAAQLGKASASG